MKNYFPLEEQMFHTKQKCEKLSQSMCYREMQIKSPNRQFSTNVKPEIQNRLWRFAIILVYFS